MPRSFDMQPRPCPQRKETVSQLATDTHAADERTHARSRGNSHAASVPASVETPYQRLHLADPDETPMRAGNEGPHPWASPELVAGTTRWLARQPRGRPFGPPALRRDQRVRSIAPHRSYRQRGLNESPRPSLSDLCPPVQASRSLRRAAEQALFGGRGLALPPHRASASAPVHAASLCPARRRGERGKGLASRWS